MSDVSKQIDDFIAVQPDWQKDNLLMFRKLVSQASDQVEEAWKWDVPVFLCGGRMVCAMSTFKDHTKFNFFDGAALNDPHGTFNSGQDSKRHRSINLRAGEVVRENHLQELIQAAIDHASR